MSDTTHAPGHGDGHAGGHGPDKPTAKASPLENKPLVYGLLALAFIIALAVFIFSWEKGGSKSGGKKTTPSAIDAGGSYEYEKTYTLKKGGPATEIKIQIGLGCEYSDPGKEFGRQTEGNPMDTIGGGRPYSRQSEYTRKVWLSALNDDVSITVYFKKIN